MIRLCDVVGLVCDTAFVLVYLGGTARSEEVPWFRRLLGLACLAAAVPLYVSSVSISNSWVRFGIRTGLYTAYLLLSGRLRPALAAYNAAFATAVCTIVHNAFLTPLTFPLLNQQTLLAPSQLWNAVLCALAVYIPTCLAYALAFWLAPLRDAAEVGRARLAGLCSITFLSLYLKEVQMPLTLLGGPHERAPSAYFIVLQAALLLCLIGFEGYQRSQAEVTALRMQRVISEALMKNIEARKAHDETVSRLRHDMKNHMLSLQLMMERGELQKAQSYVEEFLQRSARPGILFRTGNALLDGLLSEKLSAACTQDIAFSVVLDFSRGDFISPFDLCTILGNALDNAVEACLQLPPGQDRYIDVRGGHRGNLLTVRIRNSCLPRRDPAAPLRTTKEDRLAHGFGLGNIRRALDRYEGTLTAGFEQPDRFALTMTLPIPDKGGAETP